MIQQQCLLASKSLEAFFQWELNNPSKDGIIPMRNGYLAGTCPKLKEEEIDQLVENIADFKDFLEKNNISFLYANAGSNVCPYNKQMYENTFENSNENADELLSSLQKCGIDVLDFRKDMQRDDLDWYSFYYRTDHHWTTLAGLWAAGDLADKLNQDYDFLFDKSYFSTRAYDITHYDNYWLGSRGRVLTLVRAPLDDYDLIIPKFRTNFTINVPSQGLELSGDYKNVIMKMDQLEQVANYSGIDFLNKPEAYGCVNTTRYAELKLINKLHTNNPGKKILFVRDSYADYLLSYLACDVEEEDAICLQSFTGSLKAYVRETRPDIVIVLYCIDSVSPVEMKTHKHYFDFR